MKEISSIHNPGVASLRDLQKAKARREQGVFLLGITKKQYSMVKQLWEHANTGNVYARTQGTVLCVDNKPAINVCPNSAE